MPKFLDDIIVDGGAKLGIGTASPAQKLHVVGNQISLDTGGGGYYLRSTAGNFRAAFWDNGDNTRIFADGNGSTAAIEIDSNNTTFAGTITSADDVEIRSGNKLILQRPNNAVATEISTDVNGTMILNSLNNEGFKLQNNSTVLLEIGNVSSNAVFAAGATFSGALTVGVDDAGHDVVFRGNTSGAYFTYDASEDGVVIVAPTDEVALGIRVVGGAQPTVPQFTVGRGTSQYLGIKVDDRISQVIHRQDETSGVMQMNQEIWDNGSGEHLWNWRSANGSGASPTTRMTLSKSGQLTVSGELEATSLDINGAADISGAVVMGSTLDVAGHIQLTDGAQRNIIGALNQNLGIYANPNGADEGIKFSTDEGSTIEMIILNGGNVGIGTATPGAKLQVGTRGTAGALTVPTTDGILFDFHNDGSPYARHSAIISQAGDASESVIDFWTKAASGTNSKKMTIRGDGNVGIGTASPVSKFEVDGSIKVTGITSNIGTAAGLSLSYDNGINYISTWSSTPLIIQTYNYQAFHISGSEKMRIHTDGNVGIGTTSPGAKLDVSATSNATIRLSSSSANQQGQAIGKIDFYSADTSTPGAGVKSSITTYVESESSTEGDASSMAFSTSNGAVNNVERVRIDKNGNVGIGTATPNGNLQIVGKSGGSGTVLISDVDNGSAANDSLMLQQGATNSYIWNKDSGFISFGANNAERMRLTPSGQLGIGTTTPTDNSRLHIEAGHGTTRARMYYPGSTTVRHAYIDMWASEPGSTYNGSGIGSNILGSPYYGKRTTDQGMTYIRFLDGTFGIWTGTVAQSSASQRFVINQNGAATFTGTIGSGAITSTGKITGTELEGTSLDINGNADISGNLAVDGIANLDNTDIDGTFNATGTTFDVNSSTSLTLDNTNTTNGVKINTATSGSPVTIGHATSEVLIADNLTINGNLTTKGDVIIENTTNLAIRDTIITLNDGTSGTSGTDSSDIGIMMERHGANKFFGYDASENEFIMVESTEDVSGAVSGVQMGTTQTLAANIRAYDSIKIGETANDAVSVFPASTTTSLGTSNTLVPTQNAVKAYVDAKTWNWNDITAGTVPTFNQNTSGSSGSCTGNAATATALTSGNKTIGGTLHGSKSVGLTENTFVSGLTVVMSNHTSCYVKIFIAGDWSSHSGVAYLGEYFLQNGAGGYSEPGMIIREVDNTKTDTIEAKILDPSGGSGNRNFIIQFRANDTINSNGFTAVITYEVMGQYVSVS